MLNALTKLSAVFFCCAAITAHGATIHQWVGADGVTHFSDAPPKDAQSSDVITMELEDGYPSASDAQADYYSIANQWQRMRDERAEKNKLELEKQQLRAEAAAARASERPPVVIEERRNYPIFGPLGYYRQNRFHQNSRVDPSFDRGPHHVRSNGQHLRGSQQRPNRNRGYRPQRRSARSYSDY